MHEMAAEHMLNDIEASIDIIVDPDSSSEEIDRECISLYLLLIDIPESTKKIILRANKMRLELARYEYRNKSKDCLVKIRRAQVTTLTYRIYLKRFWILAYLSKSVRRMRSEARRLMIEASTELREVSDAYAKNEQKITAFDSIVRPIFLQ